MKRLLIVGLLFLTQTVDACRNCLGYTGRKLRNTSLAPVYCDCNCDQQQKVTYDQGHGYGCVRCGHRLIPKDIMTKENTTITTKAKNEDDTVKHDKKTKEKKYKKRTAKENS